MPSTVTITGLMLNNIRNTAGHSPACSGPGVQASTPGSGHARPDDLVLLLARLLRRRSASIRALRCGVTGGTGLDARPDDSGLALGYDALAHAQALQLHIGAPNA